MRAVIITVLLVGMVIVLIVVALLYKVQAPSEVPVTSMPPSVGEQAALPDEYVTPGQRTYYTHEDRPFVFEIPKGFYIEEYGVGSREPEILLTDGDKKPRILIRMSPADGSATTFSVDEIRRNVPSIEITDPQQIAIAPSASGIIFTSTSEEWGRSSEIWFVYRGTLYRVTAALELAPLQKAIISTWRFTR